MNFCCIDNKEIIENVHKNYCQIFFDLGEPTFLVTPD